MQKRQFESMQLLFIHFVLIKIALGVLTDGALDLYPEFITRRDNTRSGSKRYRYFNTFKAWLKNNVELP